MSSKLSLLSKSFPKILWFHGKSVYLQQNCNKNVVMAKFINPFTDVGFKIIFGQPWAAQNAVFQRLVEVLADGKRPQGRAAEVSKLSKEERIKSILTNE